MDVRTSVGARGERATELAYVRRGYRLLARNWRCRLGELDLVLARDRTVVICEVKTRRGTAYGGGWQAVTARKQAKIRAVAQAYVLATGVQAAAIRFDVASVEVRDRPGGPEAKIEVYEDAF